MRGFIGETGIPKKFSQFSFVVEEDLNMWFEGFMSVIVIIIDNV
jgi:hypothetical protein